MNPCLAQGCCVSVVESPLRHEPLYMIAGGLASAMIPFRLVGRSTSGRPGRAALPFLIRTRSAQQFGFVERADDVRREDLASGVREAEPQVRVRPHPALVQ